MRLNWWVKISILAKISKLHSLEIAFLQISQRRRLHNETFPRSRAASYVCALILDPLRWMGAVATFLSRCGIGGDSIM